MLQLPLNGLFEGGWQLDVANQDVVELDVVLCQFVRELVFDLELDLLALGRVEFLREVFGDDFPCHRAHGWPNHFLLVVPSAFDFQASQIVVLGLCEHGHVHVDLQQVGAQDFQGFHLLGLTDFIFVDLVPRGLEVKPTFQWRFVGIDPFAKGVEGETGMPRRDGHGQGAPEHEDGEQHNQGKQDAAQSSAIFGGCRHVHAAKICPKPHSLIVPHPNGECSTRR